MEPGRRHHAGPTSKRRSLGRPMKGAIALAAAALAALALASCGGEVEYVEVCKDVASAEACMDCCDDAGFFDWSYNSSYSPPCGCID